MLAYAFVLILDLNPGAVPRMGLHPVAPAPFGSCLFVIYAICLCGVPNKAVKKRGEKRTLNKCITNSKGTYECCAA